MSQTLVGRWKDLRVFFYVPGKLQVRLKVRILHRPVAVFCLRPGCLGGVINISELVGAAAIRTVELLRR